MKKTFNIIPFLLSIQFCKIKHFTVNNSLQHLDDAIFLKLKKQKKQSVYCTVHG